jgi:hypothetical protein
MTRQTLANNAALLSLQVNAKVAVVHGQDKEERKGWLREKQQKHERQRDVLNDLLDDVLPDSSPTIAAATSSPALTTVTAAMEDAPEDAPEAALEDALDTALEKGESKESENELANLRINDEDLVEEDTRPRALSAREQREVEAEAQLKFPLDDEELALIKSKHVRSEYFNAGVPRVLSVTRLCTHLFYSLAVSLLQS